MENNRGYIHIIKRPDVTDLAGEKVMIDFDSGNYFLLKGAANAIWDFLEEGTTTEAIVARLLAEYDVEEGKCLAETRAFLDELQKAGFISIE